MINLSNLAKRQGQSPHINYLLDIVFFAFIHTRALNTLEDLMPQHNLCWTYLTVLCKLKHLDSNITLNITYCTRKPLT